MAGGCLLGIDLGSSSVKVCLVDATSGRLTGSASSPASEMEMISRRPGWAEQSPGRWLSELENAIALLGRGSARELGRVEAVGIGYQMHGLVLVDDDMAPVRDSIIWCDSRAAGIGRRAFDRIGAGECMRRLLNSPGNFTASRLRWVIENEPETISRAAWAMLPGEFVATALTGEVSTTPCGLSEQILWDYTANRQAGVLIDEFEIPSRLIPPVTPVFSVHGRVTPGAASRFGVPADIPVTYIAGDQMNGAFSLGVLDPGQAAAAAGTSAVIFRVTDLPWADPHSRVNTFLHVNHSEGHPRYGVLACINGAGILNRWLRDLLSGTGIGYHGMDGLASSAPPGSSGLVFLPFGNGAERLLADASPGALLSGLRFNDHGAAHLLRAAQEGIAFALAYSLEASSGVAGAPSVIRAPEAGLFRSRVFGEALACATGAVVEVMATDGAQGAARAAGIGGDLFDGPAEALSGLETRATLEPDPRLVPVYESVYGKWKELLGTTSPACGRLPDGLTHG
jgi:xylulokinase